MFGRWSAPADAARPLVVAVILLLGTAVLPAVPAQIDDPVSFRVASLTAPDPVHLDGANTLSVTIQNDGLVAGTAQVRVWAENAAGAEIEFVLDEVTLLPGRTEAYNIPWDVRDGNGDAMDGPVSINAEVESDTGLASDSEEIVRSVAVHDLSLVLVQGAGGSAVNPGTVWGGAILVDVRNDGNVDEVAGLTVEGIPSGWDFPLSHDEVEVAPGDVVRVSIFVEAASDAPAFETVTVDLAVESAEPLAPSMDTLQIVSPVVTATGSLSVTVADPTAEVDPGDEVSFTVTVENDQNFDDEVAVVLLPASGTTLDAAVAPAGAVPVARGGSASYSVDVAAPADAPAGAHTWTVQAVSSEGAPVQAPSPITVDVAHVRGVALALGDDPPQTVDPGSTVEIPLDLSNNGNADDEFLVAIETLPAEWTVPTAPQTFTIPAGNTETVLWKATLASDAPAGPLNLEFTAEPVGLSSAKTPKVLHALTVTEQVNPTLAAAMPTIPVSEGETITFQLTLANVGNVAGTFDFSAQVDSADPDVGAWGLDGATTFSVDLDSGEQASHEISVTGPSGLQHTDALELTASLAPSPAGPATVLLRALPAVPDLTPIDISTDPTPAYVDETVSVQVTVRNAGAASAGPFAVHVALHDVLASGGVGDVLHEEEVEVDGLEWQEGEDTTTVEVEFVPDVPGLWALVTVDSEDGIIEADENNNAAQWFLSLHKYDVEIITPTSLEVLPGQQVSFTGSNSFQVRNNGSHAESVSIRLEAEPSWFSAIVRDVELAPGASEKLEVDFLVPTIPSTGSAILSINVTSDVLQTLTQKEAIELLVVDEEPPQITGFTVDKAVATYPQNFTLTASFQDATGIDSAKVIIVAADGTASEVVLSPNEDGDFSGNFTPVRLGDHSAYVWVRDRSTTANTNDTADSPIAFFVKPGERPAVNVVSPAEGAIIRPGTPLVYAVVSGRPIESVAVKDGVTQRAHVGTELVQVDTTTWSDGARTVNVSVTDTLGAGASVDHQVTIDGTAPSIGNITLSPNDAGQGDELSVSVPIEDTSPIQSATLRVEVDGGLAQDVPMNGTSTGFQASVTLAGPLASITVLATDAAGNTGTKEFDGEALGLDTTASRDSPLGLAAGVGLIGVLLMAALLIRWGGRER